MPSTTKTRSQNVVTLGSFHGGCMPSTTKDTEAKMSHSLSNQKSLVMTTKDTEAKMSHSLRSQNSLLMTTKDAEAKMAYSLRSQNSVLMTTSIKDALSHASVSGAVKAKFSHGYDDTK
jgi:hypothetical protein